MPSVGLEHAARVPKSALDRIATNRCSVQWMQHVSYVPAATGEWRSTIQTPRPVTSIWAHTVRTDTAHSSDDFVKRVKFLQKAKKSRSCIDAVPEISVVFFRVESPGSWAHRLSRQAMCVHRNNAAPLRKQFCREEAINIIYIYIYIYIPLRKQFCREEAINIIYIYSFA